ncbi:hypothetical protein C1645_881031 [Glomus cerebriforme]|uniref:Uncharacterized protein n=1 Tax=Glomus cerebriforme TaxID=658196 RepID=A0A397SDY4_9GLOM|nr:hypothetical protein C1645_881031 [Glomus cerebriforme]
MTSSQKLAFSPAPSNIPFLISAQRFHVINSDQRGHNRISTNSFKNPPTPSRYLGHGAATHYLRPKSTIEIEQIFLSDKPSPSWPLHNNSSSIPRTPPPSDRPIIKAVLQDPTPNSILTPISTHPAEFSANVVLNPCDPEKSPPPLSRKAQKRQAALERKQRKEAEAIALGHHHRRDFVKELSSEEYRLILEVSNYEILGIDSYLRNCSSLLSDWQFIVHAFRTNTVMPQDLKDYDTIR